ncbi:hypothetical protein J6590_000966 [Homalodisca vitripennis]|nr:hypothetical protein J6590_000966 [Homalodisca vitripennis]
MKLLDTLALVVGSGVLVVAVMMPPEDDAGVGHCLKEGGPVLPCLNTGALEFLQEANERGGLQVLEGLELVQDDGQASRTIIPIDNNPNDVRSVLDATAMFLERRSLRWDLSLLYPGLTLRVGPTLTGQGLLEFLLDHRKAVDDRSIGTGMGDVVRLDTSKSVEKRIKWPKPEEKKEEEKARGLANKSQTCVRGGGGNEGLRSQHNTTIQSEMAAHNVLHNVYLKQPAISDWINLLRCAFQMRYHSTHASLRFHVFLCGPPCWHVMVIARKKAIYTSWLLLLPMRHECPKFFPTDLDLRRPLPPGLYPPEYPVTSKAATLLPLLLGIKLNVVTLVPIVFGILIILIKKALFISKAALLLSSVLGYNQQQYQHTIHNSPYSLSHGGGGVGLGGGYHHHIVDPLEDTLYKAQTKYRQDLPFVSSNTRDFSWTERDKKKSMR